MAVLPFDSPAFQVLLCDDTRCRSMIAGRVDVLSLHSISCVSSRLRAPFMEEIIERLKKYTAQYGAPDVFWNYFTEARGIMSGSAVQHFLQSGQVDRGSTPTHSLDIYVHEDAVQPFVDRLVATGEYGPVKVRGTNPRHAIWYKFRLSILIFLEKKTDPHSKIVIRGVIDRDGVRSILNADCTLVMNMITPQAIYCLYPALLRQNIGVIQHAFGTTTSYISQMAARQHIITDLLAAPQCTRFCPRRLQNFADREYASIPLNGGEADAIDHDAEWSFQSREICTSFDCPHASTDPIDELMNRLWIHWDE
ncbi:hypothetical protein SISSUDRAFT_1083169 [Sistotremastrum suecicum HHB10207 ss-3]|uniref:Uncharacterized protein n=1 Tax=Sistotremastrum suecicum HHB10207 ss-3 TaxID=1314776 RepID=A0A165ZQL1_9AGAM|nr:hypothetical protein SISSUDRAFT_1083169 [Sistotremastrum suecicum HHB10207 ss-3]